MENVALFCEQLKCSAEKHDVTESYHRSTHAKEECFLFSIQNLANVSQFTMAIVAFVRYLFAESCSSSARGTGSDRSRKRSEEDVFVPFRSYNK